ncbi:MAG: hypothetical protein HZB65_01790 [Candidatus Aenigmarchaeota archaeon]|nr:hypothetical protein [Candidatus Aenigmarchaeota archaeon]
MKQIFTALLLIFLLSTSSQAVMISEINPRTPEYIEIYSETPLNLSDWNISDNSSIDTITCYTIPNCTLITNSSYFIIIGRNTNITDIANVTNNTIEYYYADDSALGNGLNDNGDVIRFFNSTFSFNVSYNISSEQSWSWNGSEYKECQRTPGFANNCTQPSIQQNIILAPAAENTNITLNITIALFNIIAFQESNASLKLYYNITNSTSTIYQDNATLNTTNQSAGNWIANITGTFQTCGFVESSENETNYTDNYACANLSVFYSALENISSINITGFTNSSTWGSIVFVTTDIYRGNTSKYAIYAYVNGTEKVSEETITHLRTMLSNITLKIPIQLKPNCNSGYEIGNYTIIVTGLDTNDTRTIFISGINSAMCQTTTITQTCSSGGGGSCYCAPCNTPVVKNTSAVINANAYKNISIYYAYIGEDFIVNLTLKNNISYAKKISVYSYIYDGNVLLSDGYDGIKWKKGWDANKQEIVIGPNSENNISLVNSLKNGTEEGKYKFRIRVIRDDNKEDTTNDIFVKFPETGKNTTNTTDNISQLLQKEIIDPKQSSEDNAVQQSNPISNEITGNAIGINAENSNPGNQTTANGIETNITSIKNWFFNIIDSFTESFSGFFQFIIVKNINFGTFYDVLSI